MRTLLVTNRPDRPRFETGLVDAIVASGDVTLHEVEEGWRLPHLQQFDVVVFFVKFRQLRLRAAISWQDYCGPRVIMDHDSFHDYGGWWESPHVGEWSLHVPRLGFNAMIVSGETSRRHFRETLGIRTEIVNKGYEKRHFSDLRLPRSGIGHFGAPYGARMAMLRHVRSAGIVVRDISVPYGELNRALNGFEALLVCNMPSERRFGILGRAAQKIAPGSLLRVGPAPEPMAKNFEAAAAGCAVFMDHTPDLEGLGFIDGETAIIYDDFDELVDKLQYWLGRPDDLRRIGQAAARLCEARHTWEHRAQRFHEILTEFARSDPTERTDPSTP